MERHPRQHEAPVASGLTIEQRYAFECAGYVIVRGLLAPAQIEGLLRASAEHRGSAYAQVPGLLGRDPRFAEAVFHPVVTAISAQFFGSTFTIKDTLLVFNPARIGGDGAEGGMRWPGWHRDADHGPHPFHATAWPCPLFQLRFFIALTAVTGPESGGLALYPGSHRAPSGFPFDRGGVPSGADTPTMASGDCLVMHHAVWHTALPNRSPDDRLNLQVLTAPDWIRSKERERIAPEALMRLPPEHRDRVAPANW